MGSFLRDRRVQGRGGCPSWWLTLLLVLVMLGSLPSGRAAALRQEVGERPGFELARITAGMPWDPVGWRIISALAQPAAEAPMAERSLGFVFTDVDPVVVTDAGQESLLLPPGSAWVVGQGEAQRRASVGLNAVPYVGIELVVEPDLRAGYSLGSAELQFAGAVFTPPSEPADLVLTRYDLADEQRLSFEGHPWPVLVLATAGELLLGPVGSGARYLGPGDAGSFAESFSLTAVGGAASVVTASLRISPPFGGDQRVDVGVWTWACPVGVIAAPDMRNRGCELVDPRRLGMDLRLTGPDGGRSLAADAVTGDAGALVWDGVPLGGYNLVAVLPPGFAGYAARSFDPTFAIRLRPDGTGYTFEIEDGLFVPGEYRRVNLDIYLLR